MGDISENELLRCATGKGSPGACLVDEGYAVLASDYRHPSLGLGEVADTVAAYRVLCEHPEVDHTRVGMVGTSHGAVNSLLAALEVKPVCVVDEEGATDFAARYRILNEGLKELGDNLTDYHKLDKQLWDEFADRAGGTADEVPEAFEEASVHSKAAQFTFPVLIITGDSDFKPDCLRMHDALLAAGRDSTLRYYEGAPHAFWWLRVDVPERREAEREILTFLARYLKE